MLRGEAWVALRLIRIDVARALTPSQLRIVPILPGRTLGMLAMVRYGPGSTLTYHELIVAPALGYASGRAGFWISQISVDSPASAAAGRHEWALPKTLARFNWNAHATRSYAVDDASECVEMRVEQETGLHASAPLYAPVLSHDGDGWRWSVGEGRATINRARGAVCVAPSSKLAELGFQHVRHLYRVTFDAQLDASTPLLHQ